MKILQICPVFPPCPQNFGSGVTSVVYGLSKELVRRGHEVKVYTSAALDLHRKIDRVNNPVNIEGIEVYHFPYMASYYTFFITPSIIPIMRKSIRNFDIIHLHDIRCFQSIICHHYAKQYDIPYVINSHGSPPRMVGESRLKWLLDLAFGYRILRDASKVIALTPTEAEPYSSMGVDEHRIEIAPNGIDLAEYDSLPQKGEFRQKYSITENEKIILYLARIHRIKGPDLLVRAYASLSKEFDDSRLVIVGPDDGYLSTLKRLITDLKIGPKVLFTGPLYGKDKLEAYVDADVYVLPSVYETFPVSVLEACACGTPVVVTDRCGMADLVDEEAGLMVPYDENQFREAIAMILNNAELRRQFGERGRELVKQQFSWQEVAPQIEKIYGDCIANRDSSKN